MNRDTIIDNHEYEVTISRKGYEGGWRKCYDLQSSELGNMKFTIGDYYTTDFSIINGSIDFEYEDEQVTQPRCAQLKIDLQDYSRGVLIIT